ncbi:asparagine synthase (glutamine-hydrolyzing) [Cyanobium sp. N.Huapi 1H5]|uniref:asparagine synthase (glutamine-hydrolyzing) n=1 Tax=Cyanobium sp. N.Huapi 1H5 TaxID=2823719 RepID=UPI0020CF67CA|nr:asparagine synthase (glutamine-hydrolyzing) [Cyanobium sp. N.Huapi 1H5]MCP9837702.1 asparagine synthase (glutamine-hydrolyzing) [Cyanobium sp. N.Huapi 1H5]
MCGIAGQLGRDPGDFAARVGPRLAHRGPDDAGVWQDANGCLVHRRLAILDLSPLGHQPMASTCGRWQLVFNGEIYNHAELRRRLEAEGQRFLGSGDTEVLLAWLVSRGLEGLGALRGMFAFCLYDTRERSALLARDPHGIKPLYLRSGPGGCLAFASELRALLAADGETPSLNRQALGRYLATGSVSEPDTLVAGVQRLPCGHAATWRQGRLTVQPWGALPESLVGVTGASSMTAAEAVALTRSALEDSVAAHMVSDVPVGLFLSAGLDSASLLALAPRGLHTFTIGFGTPGAGGFDESGPAARIAAHFGAHHTPLNLTADQARQWLPAFLASQDQPSIDGYNTWCVARLATEHGLKVALSGLGGDELFGGYPSFRMVPKLRRWRSLIGPAGPPAAWLLQRLPQGRRARLQRIGALLEAPASLGEAYGCFRGLFSPAETERLLAHWGLGADPAVPAVAHGGSGGGRGSGAVPGGREGVAWLEGTRYLRNQLLPDSDVMAMAAGLELRLPLVDAQLQRRLAPIPAALRLAEGKQLLARSVPELPDWFLNRPKQGFRFPFQLWLDDPASPLALRLPSTPRGIDLAPWYRRWSLMVLQHWLEAHLGLSLSSAPRP